MWYLFLFQKTHLTIVFDGKLAGTGFLDVTKRWQVSFVKFKRVLIHERCLTMGGDTAAAVERFRLSNALGVPDKCYLEDSKRILNA